MSTDLARLIRDHVDGAPVPPGDLVRVRAEGGRIRRRRTAISVVAASVVVSGLVTVVAQLGGPGERSERGVEPVVPPGPAGGLRFYGDYNSGKVSLAGQVVEAEVSPDVDNRPLATQYGLVIARHGVPTLIDESGAATTLVPEATRGSILPDFQPGARVDAQGTLVAFGATVDGEHTVIVRDLSTGADVGRHVVPVDTEIVALDGGDVFLTSAGETTVWDTGTDEETGLGGPETQVLDVRSGVLLYEGEAAAGPAAEAYRSVHEDDYARLTLDGDYLIGNSTTLVSTDGGPPLELELPPEAGSVGLTVLDSDGSVLIGTFAVEPGDKDRLFDCALPDGPCEELPIPGVGSP